MEKGLSSSWSATDPNIDLSISLKGDRANQAVVDRLLQVEHIVLISIYGPATFSCFHFYPDTELLAEDMNGVETCVSTLCSNGFIYGFFEERGR